MKGSLFSLKSLRTAVSGHAFLMLTATGVLWLAAGCGKNDKAATSGVTDGDRAKFSWLQANVFQPTCVKCHNAGNPKKGVDLTDYDAIMKRGIVVPGNAPSSKLFKTVQSGFMPMNAPRLADDQQRALSDWIQNGAPRT